ncbi:hypothetical protein Cgig2_015149 [Carnegiea gigantea]|uniref:TRF2/HOY1 PH-like domain-containing protein n=1 Tax=Carnegiea gigantea TaxID=171969 RepID=A0A9Q1KS23_9CARY|nr:hypothetical protein Cgig2_015149 [Carnegiea gigantea]
MNSFVYIDGDHNQDDHGNFDQIFFDEAGTSDINGGITLHSKPLFSLERDPQPRKHTTWDACRDFTTNKQASLVRIHRLKFAPGVLEKHYEGIRKSTEPSHFVARGNNTTHHDPSIHNQNAALQLSPNTVLHDNRSEAATSAQAAGTSAADNNQPFCHQGSDARGSDPMLQAVQCPMRSYSLHQDHTANVHQMVPPTMITPSPWDLPYSNQSSFQDNFDERSHDSYNNQWIQDYHSGRGDQPP